MSDMGSQVLDRVAEELCRCISNEVSDGDFKELAAHLELLQTVLKGAGNPATDSSRKNVSFVESETARLHQSQHELDPSSIIRGVYVAQKPRVGTLEHEPMAKLVNQIGDKAALDGVIASLHSSITELQSQSASLADQTEIRRLAVVMLSQLIPSMQESMKSDPAIELLPPLSEIDASSFSFLE